jgi:hypothetical protein
MVPLTSIPGVRGERLPDARDPYILAIAILLMASITFLDTQIRLGVAVGALYVFPILCVLRLEQQHVTLIFAIVASFLTVVKLFFWPILVDAAWMVYCNRSISILVIWSTALLGRSNLKKKDQIREISSMLTICAWSKKVKVAGEWIPIDVYLSQHLGMKLNHGITEEAAQAMLKEHMG